MSTKKSKHKQSCLRQKFMVTALLKSMTNFYQSGEALLTKEEHEQLKRDFITENLKEIVNNGLWEINI